MSVRAEKLTLQAAWQKLVQTTEMIDRGEEGRLVLMPMAQAAQAFRIPLFSWQIMEERGQELNIIPRDENVTIELAAGRVQQREAYNYFYLLLQATQRRTADRLVENGEVEEALLSNFPDLRPEIEFIKKGHTLDEADSALLHMKLYARWFSLRDKSGLPDPRNVFSTTNL